MITAKSIGDSVNPIGSRLTSLLVTYPRFIHSELMTHRCFSRNAASSRAIPIEKMMEAVRLQPAWPERWGSKARGMQDGGELRPEIADDIRVALDQLRRAALQTVEIADDIGLAKQVANRYLEPWAHITVLLTGEARGFENFFALRAHPAAQPEFQVLAYRMLAAYLKSQPRKLDWGEWHIPRFYHVAEGLGIEGDLKVATARCARLSYLTFDGEHSVEKDIKQHDKLAADGHWSPFEHCAQAVAHSDYPWSNFDMPRLIEDSRDDLSTFGGLSRWRQYRKQFPNECKTADLSATLATKPDWITL